MSKENGTSVRIWFVRVLVFVVIVVVGYAVIFVVKNSNITLLENIFENKIFWFAVLILSLAIVIVIVYFKIVRKPDEVDLDNIEDFSKEINWIKCKCGEIFPESEAGIMKDFTYRPPKILRICRHCETVLEEIDRIDVHEDIIEGIIVKKFRYTVTIKNIDSIDRFKALLDASTADGKTTVSDLDIQFNMEEKEFIATFITNTDKWAFEKRPKTVKYFAFEEV